jgi:hypothetical protein
MKHAVYMESVTIIYIQSFIKNGTGIQKINGGVHIQRSRRLSDLTSLSFFRYIQGVYTYREADGLLISQAHLFFVTWVYTYREADGFLISQAHLFFVK